MQIVVRNEGVLKNKINVYDVEPSDTLYNVKTKIQDREGIPPHRQRFMYDGKYLYDCSLTLSDYNIQHQSTIRLYPAPVANAKADDVSAAPEPETATATAAADDNDNGKSDAAATTASANQIIGVSNENDSDLLPTSVAETAPVGVETSVGDAVLAVAGDADTALPPSASAHDDMPPPPPSSTAELLPSSSNANVEIKTKLAAPAFSSTMTENSTPTPPALPAAATATATAPVLAPALATNTSVNAPAPAIATAPAPAPGTATAPSEKPQATKKSKTATTSKSKKTKDSSGTEKEKPKKKVKKLKFSVDGPSSTMAADIVGKNKDPPASEKMTKKKNKVSAIFPLFPHHQFIPSLRISLIVNVCHLHFHRHHTTG